MFQSLNPQKKELKSLPLQPRKKWQRGLYTTVFLAAVIACISFLPFVILGHGQLTLVADFNEQQTSFNMLANEAIKRGDTNWLWTADLGGDFIGTFAFYNLGSPFFWLSLLFPPAAFPYLLAPLLVLKYMVAAAGAYLYCSLFSTNARHCSWGALAYAFSSFQAINLMFNHFHDVVAFFPFLLWAAEKLGAQKKRGLFLFFVAQAALLNYFFFVGEVVFLIFYVIFRFTSSNLKASLKTITSFLIEGSFGLACCLSFLYPAIRWTLNNPRASLGFQRQTAFIYPMETYINLFKAILFPADYMAAETTMFFSGYSSMALWLPLCGCLPLFLYLSQRGKKSPLPWLKPLFILLLILAFVPVFNAFFYGFNPTYYARWFYMPTLLIALAWVSFLDKPQAFAQRHRIWLGSFLATISLGGFCILKFSYNAEVGSLHLPKEFSFLLTLALLNLLAWADLERRRFYKLQFANHLLVYLCFFSFFMPFAQILTLQNISLRTQPKVASHNTVTLGAAVREFYDSLSEEDQNKRLLTADPRNNAGLVAYVPSISSFISTVSGSTTAFYQAAGRGRHVISRNEDPYLQRFLGVKYVVSELPLKNAGDLVWHKIMPNGLPAYIYARADALPIAFTFDRYIPEFRFQAIEHSKKSRLLLQALILPSMSSRDLKNFPLYRQLQVVSEFDIVQQNLAKDEEAFLERLSESATDVRRSTQGLAFNIQADKSKACLATVPWDQNWHIFVNGQEVNFLNSLGLITFPVEAGENRVEMVYELRYKKPLRLFSLLAILSSLFYVFYQPLAKITLNRKKFRHD